MKEIQNQPSPQTKASFTIFVNMFLSLIIKKLLDTGLTSYKSNTLNFYHLIFLLSLMVILFQSFSLFLKVSTNPTYTEVLHVGIRRKLHIPALFASMITVFVLLYLLADFFSGDALTFLVGSLALAFSWLLFDFLCKLVIADYYISQSKLDEIQNDQLYVAVGRWIGCDVLLIIWSTLIIISVHKAKMTEIEAAFAMLFAFSFLTYLVLRSVKK
ncbi:MAG: hypothetical protein AUG51_23120 [Acidobacteria bacterium 13_1_20CM_3_53_8]|nr:MAG: hypothetical protein AUG51_23120 [Acidobacteria bacterium 13_1_20CM_3_53_8]